MLTPQQSPPIPPSHLRDALLYLKGADQTQHGNGDLFHPQLQLQENHKTNSSDARPTVVINPPIAIRW